MRLIDLVVFFGEGWQFISVFSIEIPIIICQAEKTGGGLSYEHMFAQYSFR